MRRLFIFIGVVLAVVALLGLGYVVLQQRGATTSTETQAETAQQAEPTTIPMQEVIVARQPIARGSEFTAESLGRTEYPAGSIPPNAIVNEAETIGKIANTEIVQGQIIVYDLLRDRSGGSTGEAAFDIPAGNIMVAFPINKQTSVAYAVQSGDVVDVLMTFSIVDLDTEFQTILPNKFSFLLQDKSTGTDGQESSSISLSPAIDKGRLNIENELYPGFEFPREDQRPRRVAQMTVQGAKVIKVGTFIDTQPVDAQTATEGAPPPTPVLPDVVSLALTPQDALVLLWARQSEAYMELALRAAGDEQAIHSTEAVTLQYMLTRFNIAVPPKLEFGIDKSNNAVTPTEPQATPPPS